MSLARKFLSESGFLPQPVQATQPAQAPPAPLRCPVYPASHPRFWRRPGGSPVCDTCHPAPAGTPREVAQAVLDAHPGRAQLLAELRVGIAWLDRRIDEWEAFRPGGELDSRYHSVLADWTAKEKALRQLFNFQGCVLAPERCKPTSAVPCDACAPDQPANDHKGN